MEKYLYPALILLAIVAVFTLTDGWKNVASLYTIIKKKVRKYSRVRRMQKNKAPSVPAVKKPSLYSRFKKVLRVRARAQRINKNMKKKMAAQPQQAVQVVGPVDKIIHQYVSLTIGVALCVVLSAIPAALVSFALLWFSLTWLLGLPVFVMLLGINFVFLFMPRLETLPLNYHGVIMFLGRPVFGTWVLGTGVNWIIPFTKVVQVNVSEQIMNIPHTKEDPGFSVTTLKEAKDGETGGKLALWVRAAPRWKVRCSRTYIMFENDPQVSKLFEELRNKIISALRLIAAALDDETFTRSKDLLGACMLDGGVNDILQMVADSIPDASVTADKVIEHSINSIALAKWGVTVLEIIISKVEPKDSEIEKVRSGETRERYQRRSETTEANHIQARIEFLADYYVRKGKMLEQEAVREATRVVMAQLGKVTTFDFGQRGGDVTQAAAVFAQTQAKPK